MPTLVLHLTRLDSTRYTSSFVGDYPDSDSAAHKASDNNYCGLTNYNNSNVSGLLNSNNTT
jgi:hypothetical protein